MPRLWLLWTFLLALMPSIALGFRPLEYGTSRPTLILAAPSTDSASTIYADVNGDLRLEEGERFALVEQTGTVRLLADTHADTSLQDLLVRYDGRRFSVAAGGHLEGHVELGDQTVFARIIDQDVNGRFGDDDDRLLLDLNEDVKFSPLRERFASRGVLRVRGQRYTIGYGDDERSIRLLPLVGTGYLIPKLPLADPTARVTDFTAESHRILSVRRLRQVPAGWHLLSLSTRVAG